MMLPPCLVCVLAESGDIGPDQWLLIIAAIVIITLLLMQSSRRRGTNGSPKQYRREIDSATNKSAVIKRDMERLLVELSELARQINGQIDTRYAKLEQSIADADKRIQFLRVLLAAAKKANLVDSDGSEDADQSIAKTSSDAGTAPSEAVADGGAASGGLDVRVDDEGVSVAGAPEPKGAGSDNDAVSTSQPDAGDAAEDESGIDEITRRAYVLSDAGRTPIQIAQELGQNLGEVELILNLRSPSEEQHAPPST